MATCKSVLSVVVMLVSAVSPASEERKAIAVLKGDVGVTGNVTFTQIDDGPVTVTGIVTGLSKGNHGFHIHEKGDISSGCTSTKGHFNPEGKKHGGPTDTDRHVGDLGNIFAEDKRRGPHRHQGHGHLAHRQEQASSDAESSCTRTRTTSDGADSRQPDHRTRRHTGCLRRYRHSSPSRLLESG
ncbi:hypothetical protein LSTR_LSTR007161 [Laodelphax striatellus]|uniref:Superoxide dismutase copper/zinc binding domain-containing protein n=1 Tax=Laodelphax striatellus TaxID=195883 RepID=A0A482WW01_LAOST|nr:hypothetical protein LSTR_LSTR007161 [Laodelphax striatellus]